MRTSARGTPPSTDSWYALGKGDIYYLGVPGLSAHPRFAAINVEDTKKQLKHVHGPN